MADNIYRKVTFDYFRPTVVRRSEDGNHRVYETRFDVGDWLGKLYAMSKAGNLVNKNQQIDFKKRLNPENSKYRQEAERVLYDIYCNPDCPASVAFENAAETFGAKYDTIAYLFFKRMIQSSFQSARDILMQPSGF